MTNFKADVDTAPWFRPFRMVSEDPLRYELRLDTDEPTFSRMQEYLREQGWVEKGDGIWTPPDDAAGQHRAQTQGLDISAPRHPRGWRADASPRRATRCSSLTNSTSPGKA